MIKTISQTKLNRNFKENEKMLKTEPVVVYKNNKPAFATIPYEVFLELFDIDQENSEINTRRYIEVITGKKETNKGEEVWTVL